MAVTHEDEGARCPFLLEHDDSKVVTCMCNYYSLGQAEIARALLKIIASRNLKRALQIVRTIIWHGPPKHWLCSVFVPSSAHLAWMCLIDFQDLVETHVKKPAVLPPWLRKRLEFDVLIAQALLDGAAIKAQVLTAEVASELRAYHAGLLCATSKSQTGLAPALQVPASFKLPALSLLQVTNQVSPYVNFLPSHTTDRKEQSEHFNSGSASLTKAAVQQLYDLCKGQPLIGRCISLALAPAGCVLAAATGQRIHQMNLGLTADALLQTLKGDAWRYLKFLDLPDTSIPQPVLELFSILLVVVISDIRPTPALYSRLQTLVSQATSTLSVGSASSFTGFGSDGDGEGPQDDVTWAWGSCSLRRGLPSSAHAAANQVLAEIFSQAVLADGGFGVKPWEQLRFPLAAGPGGLAKVSGGLGAGGAAARNTSARNFSRFLNQIAGHQRTGRDEDDAGDKRPYAGEGARGAEGVGRQGGAVEGADEAEVAPEETAAVFQYRTKIYEAFLTHDQAGGHFALRLFSVLEDGYLRLKSAQSAMPPAFELLQPHNPDLYLFKGPPITFWDAYFEFTRVAGEHCLEYVVKRAVRFINARDFCASAWLLAPFPQLKPLVILLCWPEFSGDVESRQNLLDTLWSSYSTETKQDPTKTGDLLVDHWVEVLNYNLSVSWWISRLVVDERGQADGHDRAAADTQGGGSQRPPPPSSGARGDQARGGRSGGAVSAKAEAVGRGGGASAGRPAGGEASDEQGRAVRLAHAATEVLDQITSHSILYVMRPNLPKVQSSTLLAALQSLPPLRQAAAALEHSFDLDLTRCYYTVRCAMFIVERCVHAQGSKGAAYDSHAPGRPALEEGMRELDRLITSIGRTPMKVSVFLLIASLCFTRHRHLKESRPRNADSPPASDFLVPPSVLLSLLSLLRHHLRPLAAGQGSRAEEGADGQLLEVIQLLDQFSQETIWRMFIGLKDFFSYSRLAALERSRHLAPAQHVGPLAIAEEAATEWADAVGAVVLGELRLEDCLSGAFASGSDPGAALFSSAEETGRLPSDHPFLQFCTPMEVPLSLQPATFLPRMLSSPATLLHRTLKLNDYGLGRQVLQRFPDLRGGAIESIVLIAERFRDIRHRLVGSPLQLDGEEMLSDDLLKARLGESFESDLQELVTANVCCRAVAPLATASSGGDGEGPQEVALLLSLSGPLLSFYVLVDLAISAAPFSQLSTYLLKKASPCLESDDMPRSADSTHLPFSDALRSFLQNWVTRLTVLVEVRPELQGQVSLASIILGIETLPSEPALLKSHLNRLHSQRHAIMSLVESVDLVKKGQTSASQRTLVDFLSSAIRSLTSGEDDSTGARAAAVADAEALDPDAEHMAEGLGASRYLLKFLEYLAKVADLMRSASMEAQARKSTKKTNDVKRKAESEADLQGRPTKELVIMDVAESSPAACSSAPTAAGEALEDAVEVTKLFDVLAESPKGIVARLLFELGGHRQALALSEVMDVDVVEVIVNSSWTLPAWTRRLGHNGRPWNGADATNAAASRAQYPMSMEVVQYLAQHERPLPQVRCPEAPLLATMACLERRGSNWPSWQMLCFAKEQSKSRFPSIHRWVEERCDALHAIQWAGRSGGARGALNGYEAEPEAEADAEPDDAAVTATAAAPPAPPRTPSPRERTPAFSESPAACGSPRQTSPAARGYAEEELHLLGLEDQLALGAIGDDHEAGMSAAYTKLVHALIRERRYVEALQVCDEYLPLDSELTDQVLHLILSGSHDAELREPTPFATHAELLDHECMYRLKRHTLAARLTLERYKRWDVDTAVQTLSMCVQRMEMQQPERGSEGHNLRLELRRILQKMITFEKILKVSRGRWRVWQEIEDMDETQVGDAVGHLLELQQHDLARTLTQMYGLTDPLHSLELSWLHYFFTKKNDKTSAVNRLLASPPAQAVSFALQLLDIFDLIQHRVLLCSMMLTHPRLHSWLSPEQDEHLRVLLASLQLLGAVSETMQPHFSRVLGKPALILESLLMNARVDLLEPFLADFPKYRHDALILRYARKALALSPSPPPVRGQHASLGGGGGSEIFVPKLLVSDEEGGDAVEEPSVDEKEDEGDEASALEEAVVESRGLGGRWCLTGNAAADRRLRKEHVFEVAPSIGLAKQILELCSDRPENASSCFGICHELSLRLHSFTAQGKWPQYIPTGHKESGGVDGVGGGSVQCPSVGAFVGEGALAMGDEEQGAPRSSVRLVMLLVRRLLTYLQQKFAGAGPEVQAQLERSLRNLDFVPIIWQASGHKVGLAQLCDRKMAADLRDWLIVEDHLDLALELCERCGGGGSSASTWHISADPVREAKAVALQKLRRFAEARAEFNKTEFTATQAANAALESFESAMRYPPLLDLSVLEHVQSVYTFNSLQRKLYRSTAPLASLPTFHFPPGQSNEGGAGAPAPMEEWLGGIQVPPVPVVPRGWPADGSTLPSTLRSARNGAKASSSDDSAWRLQVLEGRLRDSVSDAKRRRSQRRGGGGGGSREEAPPHKGFGEGEPLFVNGVTHLCPPIHPPEMPSWSALQYLPRSGPKAKEARGGQHHHSSAKEAIAGALALCASEGITPDEGSLAAGAHGLPPAAAVARPLPPDDKELQGRQAEEGTVAGEPEAEGEAGRVDEEGDGLQSMPDVRYERLMMDMTCISIGCASSTNLRSLSNLWPEDNHTHSLMTASPMALPLAVPLPPLPLVVAERQLSERSFNELLHYQEVSGTAASLLSMLVRERHLSQACYYIFNEKVSKQLFVDVVAHHCLAHNQFHELQKVILDFDPSLRRVQDYLTVLKDFLRDRRALDLLYCYEVFTKDYMNAGLLAIQLFIASNTWDARVGHLQNAHAHLSVAHRQRFGRRRHDLAHIGDGPHADVAADSALLAGGQEGGQTEADVGAGEAVEITESSIRRSLDTVKLQMSIVEAMPTDMPQSLNLFGNIASQCEVAERLLCAAHFDLAQRAIDFLDLPVVEVCVRASNQIATGQARSATGSIAPIVRFLEAVPKLPPVEWDSLVTNVVNIWIIEKSDLGADVSSASQLIRFIHDPRCQMDAHVLTGGLAQAFQIAQRRGTLQEVFHIRSCVQKSGDQDLLKQINSFLAYTRPSQSYM